MVSRAGIVFLTNRQMKKAIRRDEIVRAAKGLADDDDEDGDFAIAKVAERFVDDDVVRSEKVYNAVRIETEKAGGRPFSADYKLADPPCRLNEDQLEPFLLRVARRLDTGSPRVEFRTRGAFSSPSHATWKAFVGAMVATDIRTLLAHITQLSRIVG